MFARLSATATIASLAILAAAIPHGKPSKTVTVTAKGSAPTGGSCSTGPVQCCNSVQSASSPAGSLLLGLLGIVVQGVDVLIGLDCSPISVIGVGSGSSCSSNVVCCQNNAYGGLVSIGCVPVSL